MAKAPKKQKRKSAPTEATRRVKVMAKTLPQLIQASDELRPHVAEWLLVIRSRIANLCDEVNKMRAACRAGTVLGRVITPDDLMNLICHLDEADCAACNLNLCGVDLPIPPVLTHRNIAREKYPDAEEAARLFHEAAPPDSK